MISCGTTVTIVTVWVTVECTVLVFIFKRVVSGGVGGVPPHHHGAMPLLLVHFS